MASKAKNKVTKKEVIKKPVAKKEVAKKVVAKKPVAKEVKKEPVKKVVKKIDQPINNNVVEVKNEQVKGAFGDAKALFAKDEYKKALEQLKALRKEGANKVLRIKDENINIKINKQLSKEEKAKLLAANKEEMIAAKAEAKKNKAEIKKIVHETKRKLVEEFNPIFKKVCDEKKACIIAAKNKRKEDIERIHKEYQEDLNNINSRYANGGNNKDKKIEIKAAKISFNSKLNATKTEYTDAILTAKENKYKTFQEKHEYVSQLYMNKLTAGDEFKNQYQTYIRNFNLSNWLLKNALLLIVLVFFIIMLIFSKGRLLEPGNVVDTLTEIAPKMFFALGVAGLILLGGTDLSIGRLTAVGAAFTLMILTSGTGYKDINGISWFGWINVMPAPARVCFAILFSILICTLFTSISGFFTAKFKMHPFISTLAIQLIVFGLFQSFWSGTSAFIVKPDADGSNIATILAGSRAWLLIVYAVVAIAVVWFIWNKTRFGKHLYAVGGNQEAAVVSGINPFAVTLLAFVMAGILYGCGGFVEALKYPSSNFASYNGTETDAIAACVIGGVSFSGGVGTIGGVVGGVVILGFLDKCFQLLNFDANIRYIIKGIIILVAVTLDCMKYIRKK